MRFRTTLAALLLVGACAGPPAGARSPALMSPETLAGVWTLTVEGRAACKLRLTVTPAAQGYGASPQGGCPFAVAQWRPVPDGVELAGPDGLTLILLAPSGANAFSGFDGERRPARMVR
ncbi:AprI/Inh family metalloprotease inhibitor [Phenylobacterium terrae]|uniref:AprI/Inh family metalloprotease inhibitor n=1 Tax=Phenylobacterium terrae TaxID=2665495 RepID=A0ABW4MX28_9CAUL